MVRPNCELFAFCRPPLVTGVGGMTKSQIGQAFGNDVLERSRPCRVAHVHSSRKWQWVAYEGSIFFIRFGALINPCLQMLMMVIAIGRLSNCCD